MAVSVSNIVDQCSRALYDKGAAAFSRQSLVDYVSEALLDFSIKTQSLKVRDYSIPANNGVQFYNLPSDFISITRIGFGENEIAILPISERTRDTFGLYRNEEGYPQYLFTDNCGLLEFGVWAIPNWNALRLDEQEYVTEAANGLISGQTFPLLTGESFINNNILLDGTTNKYYQYSGSVSLSGPNTIAFIDAGVPAVNEIQSLIHTDAVWTEVGETFVLDYARKADAITVTVTNNIITVDDNIDSDIPDFLGEKLYLWVCYLQLNGSDNKVHLAKANKFFQRANDELFGRATDQTWVNSRYHTLQPL